MQPIVQLHRHLARHVVVAGARILQRGGRAAFRRRARYARQRHQAFQRFGHRLTGQPKIAVAPLFDAGDQPLLQQFRQMCAGGGRATSTAALSSVAV